jgi:hypothetical protein
MRMMVPRRPVRTVVRYDGTRVVGSATIDRTALTARRPVASTERR